MIVVRRTPSGVFDPGNMPPAAEAEAVSVSVSVSAQGPGQVREQAQGAQAGWSARDQMGPDVGKQLTTVPDELLRFVLDDAPSSAAASAERAFPAAIEAGRTALVGALAEIDPPVAGPPGDIVPVAGGAPTVGMISLRAVVASSGGLAVLRRGAPGPAVDPEALGHRLADELLFAGARTLMGIS
jgi:hydroxymethylbilane synthase